MRLLLCPFLFLFSVSISTAQKKASSCDCDKAEPISIEAYTEIGNLLAPKGIGKKMEVQSTDPNDSLSFEKEHNIAWYQVKSKISGDMTFRIIPDSAQDDFDFMLYRYDGLDFCKELASGKVRPVRTNISHPDTLQNGKTGLMLNAKKEFVKMGTGNSFSKFINIKAGQQYYLVIDKVNKSPGGYKLIFTFPITVTIDGNVTNEDSAKMVTEISLTDRSGDEVNKTQTDSMGNYSFKAEMVKRQDYYLTYYNDSSFIESKVINTSKPNSFRDLKTVMPKLRGGKKYVFENVNFFGDSPIVLPQCNGTMEALYMLMKKNRRLVIEIDGHVNGPGNPNLNWFQELSEDRAKTVYDFLVQKGINPKRLSKKGFGNTQMLYPLPHNEFEKEQNRRVEINVIKIR